MPRYREDLGAAEKDAQLQLIADSISDVADEGPRAPREWAALLLVLAYHESTFSLRIHRGECKPHECDRGRARSPWQLHKNTLNAPLWDQLHGIEFTAVQARAASDALRRAYFTCSRSGTSWLRATINAYAGKRCNAEWYGLERRIRTYRGLMSITRPKPGIG